MEGREEAVVVPVQVEEAVADGMMTVAAQEAAADRTADVLQAADGVGADPVDKVLLQWTAMK